MPRSSGYRNVGRRRTRPAPCQCRFRTIRPKPWTASASPPTQWHESPRVCRPAVRLSFPIRVSPRARPAMERTSSFPCAKSLVARRFPRRNSCRHLHRATFVALAVPIHLGYHGRMQEGLGRRQQASAGLGITRKLKMRVVAGLFLAGSMALWGSGASWAQTPPKGAAAPQAPAQQAAPAPTPALPPGAAKMPCANPDALGISRVVEIDTTGGPGFGFEHFKQLDFLRDHEVVLTFDDG